MLEKWNPMNWEVEKQLFYNKEPVALVHAFSVAFVTAMFAIFSFSASTLLIGWGVAFVNLVVFSNFVSQWGHDCSCINLLNQLFLLILVKLFLSFCISLILLLLTEFASLVVFSLSNSGEYQVLSLLQYIEFDVLKIVALIISPLVFICSIAYWYWVYKILETAHAILALVKK